MMVKMKKAIDIIFVTVMAVVMIFAFLLVGMRLFGLTPYAVISGSMEPEYPVGSLIYVKKAGADELSVNDPITYVMKNGMVVTHRIIEVLPDEDNPTVVRYRTKGDANEDPDGDPVHINNVIGKPIFKIPLVGYIAHFVQNPPGSYITICALVLFTLFSFLPNILDRDGAEAEDEEDAEARLEAEELVNELSALREDLVQRRDEMSENAPPGESDEKKQGESGTPSQPINDDF